MNAETAIEWFEKLRSGAVAMIPCQVLAEMIDFVSSNCDEMHRIEDERAKWQLSYEQMSEAYTELDIKNDNLDRENDRLRLQIGKFRMHIAG